MWDYYIQHNSTCADGKAGFLESIKGFLSLGPQIVIIRLNSEDDMVHVFFKCTLKNGHTSEVCDIYRLQAASWLSTGTSSSTT